MSTCCPARWPAQHGRSSASVQAAGVSRRFAVTVPTCQSSRRWTSVAPVALLTPRVSAVVVAEALPEAGLVTLADLEPAHPFRALPEVQVRDEQPCGTAVLGGERRALGGERHPRLAAGDVVDRQVRRVAAVAEGGPEGPVDLDPVEQRVDRDALPGHVEPGPLRHAVDVAGDRLERELAELLPGPRAGGRDRSGDGE